MKHVGDITKLHGYDLPPVDVITGGSPCQDLSVAGKRAGMLHEANGDAETTRSGLFYDQIRVIKEMREAYVQESGGSDQLVRGVRYPRYSIWENVPGALSAGKEKGEAFQAVLTEFVRIVEPDAPPVPMPDKGKWPTAGCLYDPMGRWSVAWRVHDLQFWGCPQRRKRLCVLCDFDGASAPWLLFDPQFRGEAEDTPPVEAESDSRTEPRSEVQPLGEGLRGNPQSSQPPRQGVAEGTEDCSGGASYTLKVRGGIEVDSHGRKAGKGPLVQTELSGTLGVSQDQTLIQPCMNPNDPQSKRVFDPEGIAPTLNSGTSEGKNIVPSVCLNPWDVQSKHIQSPDGIAEALYSGECRYGGGESYVMAEGVVSKGNGECFTTGDKHTSLSVGGGQAGQGYPCVMAFTQNQREEIRDLEDRAGILSAENGSHQQTYVAVDVYNQSVDGEVAASLTAASGGSNTSGPKVMSAGFKPRQGAAARSLGYEEEMSPTVNTDENYGVLCLNDQGGGVMNITEDKTNALRAQMKHHEPIVYNGETVTCPTNKQTPTAGDPCHTLTDDTRNYLVYENHSQDSRYKDLGDISETVSAKYGTGGNNQPLVLESNQNHATVTDSGIVNTLPSSMGMGGGYVPMVVDDPIGFTNRGYASGEVTETLRSDPHGAYPCIAIDQQGGKGGANYAEDVCPAVLSDSHGTPHAVAYGIDHVVTTGGNCTAQGPCYYEETEATLKAAGPHAVAYGISAYDSNAMKSSNPHSGIYEADSARTLDLNGGSPACNQGGVAIVEPVPIEGNGQRESHRGDGYGESGDPMFTLNSTEHHAVAGRNWDGSETSPTLTKNNAGGNQRMPDKDNFNAVLQEGVECMQNGWYQSTGDQAPSLLARDYKDPPVVKKPKSVVRRLTPVECERLQGFPDYWTDLGEWTDSKGKKHKDADSPRYKALGNSIGLPFWQWLAERISAQYDRPVTLGSLFDGIGGFPLVFERCGGKAVWASEIEEFPIAVTKKHFPEE